MHLQRAFPVLMMLLLAVSPVSAEPVKPAEEFGPKEKAIRAYKAAIREPSDDAALQAYLDTLPQVTSRFSGRTHYIVEGDIRMTAEDVRHHLDTKKSARFERGSPQDRLLVQLDATGKRAIWPKPQRQLKYAVLRSTFPSERAYDKVVSDMTAATNDWETLCPDCGIDFEHVPELDSEIQTLEDFKIATAEDEVRFVVHYEDFGGEFIAAAFFPISPRDQRMLTIDPTYYYARNSRGILRHELGHILGYRHEHIRGIQGCYWEEGEGGWAPVTPYDPHSVMHYLCGGGGTPELKFTDIDSRGHRKLYGGPERQEEQ